MINILIGSAVAILFSTILAIISYILHISALAIVAGVIFVLSLGTIIGAVVIYFTQRNDYRKAVFFIDDGFQVKKKYGELHKTGTKAIQYKTDDSKIITVPHSYGYKYFLFRRKIDISPSNSLILPSGKIIEQSEYDSIIQELTLGTIGADIVRAVSSHKFAMNWIIAAVIAFIVGAVGASLFGSFQKQQAAQQQPAIIQPVQPQADTIIVEGGENK